MVKKISCQDFGIPCNFVALGNNALELKEILFKHMAVHHPEYLQKMTPLDRVQVLTKIYQRI